MTIILSVSSVLLITMIVFRHLEFVRGKGRVFELPRRRLDRMTGKVLTSVRDALQYVFELIHKDVFLYGIHLVVYVALFVVRFVERWLDRIVSFIRSFRKRRKNHEASERLRDINRGEEPVEKSEHNL